MRDLFATAVMGMVAIFIIGFMLTGILKQHIRTDFVDDFDVCMAFNAPGTSCNSITITDTKLSDTFVCQTGDEMDSWEEAIDHCMEYAKNK